MNHFVLWHTPFLQADQQRELCGIHRAPPATWFLRWNCPKISAHKQSQNEWIARIAVITKRERHFKSIATGSHPLRYRCPSQLVQVLLVGQRVRLVYTVYITIPLLTLMPTQSRIKRCGPVIHDATPGYQFQRRPSF